jgi:hypothetical protein
MLTFVDKKGKGSNTFLVSPGNLAQTICSLLHNIHARSARNIRSYGRADLLVHLVVYSGCTRVCRNTQLIRGNRGPGGGGYAISCASRTRLSLLCKSVDGSRREGVRGTAIRAEGLALASLEWQGQLRPAIGEAGRGTSSS